MSDPANPSSEGASPSSASQRGDAALSLTQVAHALFEQSPLSTVIYDAEGHVLALNAAFEALWNVRLEDVPAGYSVLTDPELERQGALPAVRRAFAGEAVTSPPVLYDIREVAPGTGGRRVWSQGHFYPVRDASGRLTYVVLTHIDLTERMESDAALRASIDQARQLQHLTAQLNQAASVEQIADVILDGGLAAVGADAASLARLRHGSKGAYLKTLRTRGYGEETTLRYRRYPVTPGRPLSDAVLEQRLVMMSIADASPGHEDAVREMRAHGYETLVAIPVIAGGRAIAGLTFSFRTSRTFDDATRTFLMTLAEQCALALDRARLHATEVRLLERNTAILESIRDGFVAFDEAGRFRYVNRRAAEMLGRTREELIGRTTAEVFPGLETPITDAALEAVRTDAPTRREQYSPILGRWIDARFYPTNGSVTVFFQDVSERHRQQVSAEFLAEASRVLASSLDYEATLRAVARAAVPTLADWCAVDVLVDPSSTTWPPVLQHIAIEHQDRERIALGVRFRDEYPTDWSDEASATVQVLRTGKPLFVPVITPEMLVGGARDEQHLAMMRALDFSAAIVVPLTARGRTLGVLTLCMSESHRRYDEADLAVAQDLAQRAAIAVDNARLFRDAEQARAEAEAASLAKTQFLATMSHELRTPLNAIAGYADLMDLGVHGTVTEEQHADIERIRRSQRHLLALVDDVLNLARIEARRVDYVVSNVRVSDVFDIVVALVQPQASAQGLELGVSLDDPALTVRADREKLQQVVINLASNAVKFTERGGRIALSAKPDGDAVRIHVRDTGRGIPADKLEQIFHPFVQVEAGLTRTAQGSGLGLAIARDLARGMDGDVTVESAQGEGSDFTITLPRAGVD